MKIYTKTGDEGNTGLFGGKRLPKDDIRIEAYGTVDELNAFIGLLQCNVHDGNQKTLLGEVQNRLFTIGSNLASDPDKEMITPDIHDDDIKVLEEAIDQMNQTLPALKHFILPGGSISVSNAHICRTICRRAERRTISLNRISKIDPKIIIYLNRLSDYFFVLARYVAMSEDVGEISWIPRKS